MRYAGRVRVAGAGLKKATIQSWHIAKAQKRSTTSFIQWKMLGSRGRLVLRYLKQQDPLAPAHERKDVD